MPDPPVILSIAGYDPSSGAGVTADIKTAAALGCYAVTCITALTVQSTQGVFAVEPVRVAVVGDTLARLRQDFDIAAVRLGMLGSGEVAEQVADFLESERLPNIVLDPVIRSSSGTGLLDDAGLGILRRRLLPLSTVITPNIEEAAALGEAEPPPGGSSWRSAESQLRDFSQRLHDLGAPAVLITGGHLADATDFLSRRDQNGRQSTQIFPGEHIQSTSTHGTGCALATALACLLAKGIDLPEAVAQAKAFVRRAIEQAYPLGKGTGPLNHLFGLEG